MLWVFFNLIHISLQCHHNSIIKNNKERFGYDDESDPRLISCTYLLVRQLFVGINLVSAAFLLDPEAFFEPIDSQKMRQSARK